MAIALQALNACLLFAAGAAIGLRRPAAFLAALFFAIHPAFVETVNIVTFNEDPIALVFLLSALILHVRHRASVRSLALAPLLYGLACFTKETAFVFPAALLLYDALLDRSSGRAFRIRPEIPVYAAAAVAFLAVYLGWSMRYSGWQAPAFPLEVIWTVPKTFAQYIFWILVPQGGRSWILTDPAFIAHSGAEPLVWLSVGTLALLALLGWRCRRRDPLVSFGIAWFFIFLLPVLGVSRSIMAGRYLYIPSVGIFWAALFIMQPAESRWKRHCRTVITGLFLSAEVFGTLFSNLNWRSNIAYFSAQVEKQPQNALARLALGNAYSWREDYRNALDEYRMATALAPGWSLAQSALGAALAQAEYPKESEAAFRRALELDGRSAEAWDGLGVLYARRGDPDQAERAFKSALEIRPGYETALRHLRQLRERKGP